MRGDLQKFHPWTADEMVLREALEAGEITQSDEWYDQDSIISGTDLEAFQEQFSRGAGENTSDLENAGRSPKSLHYRARSRGRRLHPEETAPFAHWSTELSRFVVPLGHVGVVKGFEQYLATEAFGQNPAIVYTASSRWGIPGPWHTGDPAELDDVGIWHFRLQALVSGQPDPPWHDVVGVSAGQLPGQSYPDYPAERLLWYPAHSSASQNLHLLVPGGYVLRLIFEMQARDDGPRVDVAAFLRGFVQSDRTSESAENVRTNW